MLQKLQLQSENMQIAINPGLEKRLMSTLELPENELKLLNAMNMRLIIAKFSQARNEQMNSKAQKLLELVEMEIRELLDEYDFPGEDTPIITGSALKA